MLNIDDYSIYDVDHVTSFKIGNVYHNVVHMEAFSNHIIVSCTQTISSHICNYTDISLVGDIASRKDV